MNSETADRVVKAFENGVLSRRELVTQLMGLGAAGAVVSQTASGAETDEAGATFRASGLDHVALNVSDLSRSEDFYAQHLGLRRVGGSGNRIAFLAAHVQSQFALALFSSGSPGLNHYAYAIRDYDPQAAVEALKAAGVEPRREQNRVYFDAPDGVTVQVT